jgi:hypothetical protein
MQEKSFYCFPELAEVGVYIGPEGHSSAYKKLKMLRSI